MIKNTEIYELVKERIEQVFVVPDRVRDKIWNEIQIDSSGLVLVECRPVWDDEGRTTRSPIFKLKYNSKNKTWSVYWMPSDMKWHKLNQNKKLDNAIKYIKNNPDCFWG